MRPLPKEYMLKSHAKRVALHEEICATLENISDSLMPNIYKQLGDAQAKRMLFREILIGFMHGDDIQTTLVSIENTMANEPLDNE